MSFDSSDSETELLVLNDRNRKRTRESDYYNPQNNRRTSSSKMGSLKQIFCG